MPDPLPPHQYQHTGTCGGPVWTGVLVLLVAAFAWSISPWLAGGVILVAITLFGALRDRKPRRPGRARWR